MPISLQPVSRGFSALSLASIPPEFRDVLARIEVVLGKKVLVHGVDGEWLSFTLAGLDDRTAIMTMEREVRQILPPQVQHLFQILCPWDPSDGSGLWLHSLGSCATRSDYLPGCWFY